MHTLDPESNQQKSIHDGWQELHDVQGNIFDGRNVSIQKLGQIVVFFELQRK